MLRDMDVRRRLVPLTLAVAVIASGPALYAAASPGAAVPSLGGTIAGTDIAHHHIGVKVTTGAAKYKGKTVAILLHKTAVTRLGKTVTPAAIKKNDRVTVTYSVNAKTHVITALKIIDTGPKPKPAPTPSPTTTPATTTFNISAHNYSFTPSNIPIKVGTTVVVSFTGEHTFSSRTGAFDSGDHTGGVYSFTFNTPGTYPFFCMYHDDMGMNGTITVTS